MWLRRSFALSFFPNVSAFVLHEERNRSVPLWRCKKYQSIDMLKWYVELRRKNEPSRQRQCYLQWRSWTTREKSWPPTANQIASFYFLLENTAIFACSCRCTETLFTVLEHRSNCVSNRGQSTVYINRCSRSQPKRFAAEPKLLCLAPHKQSTCMPVKATHAQFREPATMLEFWNATLTLRAQLCRAKPQGDSIATLVCRLRYKLQ